MNDCVWDFLVLAIVCSIGPSCRNRPLSFYWSTSLALTTTFAQLLAVFPLENMKWTYACTSYTCTWNCGHRPLLTTVKLKNWRFGHIFRFPLISSSRGYHPPLVAWGLTMYPVWLKMAMKQISESLLPIPEKHFFSKHLKAFFYILSIVGYKILCLVNNLLILHISSFKKFKVIFVSRRHQKPCWSQSTAIDKTQLT